MIQNEAQGKKIKQQQLDDQWPEEQSQVCYNSHNLIPRRGENRKHREKKRYLKKNKWMNVLQNLIKLMSLEVLQTLSTQSRINIKKTTLRHSKMKLLKPVINRESKRSQKK